MGLVFLAVWLIGCVLISLLWGSAQTTADIAGILGMYFIFGIVVFSGYLLI